MLSVVRPSVCLKSRIDGRNSIKFGTKFTPLEITTHTHTHTHTRTFQIPEVGNNAAKPRIFLSCSNTNASTEMR